MKNFILKANSLQIKYCTAFFYLDLSEGCFTSTLLWKQLGEGITIWGAEFMLYLSQGQISQTYSKLLFLPIVSSLQAKLTWRAQSTITDPLYLFVLRRNQGRPLRLSTFTCSPCSVVIHKFLILQSYKDREF